ncbi:hypothetical protein EJ06DRAFT_481637 [Trichodelitschia bisporula]|uniref:laccase n=1 Tax=Trichodelitschia bisporula TaxID=703511 RepID=A0A6G1HP02_9PEZI|nr:hypothetical protein EJ06DRAFT_481637 [Trichodelitschia bisporula]
MTIRPSVSGATSTPASSAPVSSTRGSSSTSLSVPVSVAPSSAASGISSSPVSSSAASGISSSPVSSSAASSTLPSNSTSTIDASEPTGSACPGNTADDRSQWCDFDISTDYYATVPDTNVTREYWFELVELNMAPDGFSRPVMTVNGSIPGPTVFADWGDEVIIHVTNNLAASKNGSSIHWHGLHQKGTLQADGVVSVTQCPSAPGTTYTYKWRATQYGSSWYHSHFALQAWEGVFGGIVIRGPTTANYDVDLGNLFLQDWSHQTVDELYMSAQLNGPTAMDNGLINGTNVFGADGDAAQTGKRFEVNFEPGKSHLLRLVNVAIDTHFKFMIDNHTMTVVAADFVPIEPYQTDILNIAMGQRYDVIVTANKDAIASDFWLRAVPQIACSDNDSVDNIKGIVHYGTSTGTPTTIGAEYTDACIDEVDSKLVPALAKPAGDQFWTTKEVVTVARNSENYFRWFLNGTSMLIKWENPTLMQVQNNATGSFSQESNMITLPNANEWIYLIVETAIPVPHPLHLHGHDFSILASGTGRYDPTTVTLNRANPPRRDVAILPGSGYVVLAWQTDNPGAWLMHCHIGWHTLEGFALQFLEREDDIKAQGLIDQTLLGDTCDAWSTYAATEGIVQIDDSGI